jgi:hypothetical protein
MRLPLSGLIATLLALGSAAPAFAGDYVHTDPTGDMWRSGVEIEDPYSPDPGQVEGDITRVQMRHNRRHVQLFMTVREAERETTNTWFFFSLQNGRKQRTDVNVSTYTSARDGVLTIKDPRYRDKKCRGLKGFKINWDTNTVAITIPRTCVGRPKLLRLTASDALQEDPSLDHFIDYAQTGLGYRGPTVWSPWVRRG